MEQKSPAVQGPLDGRVRPVSEARWCVEDASTGMPLAQGTAPTAQEASYEATHYAVQYAQDHPVRWWVRQNRKTVLKGSMAGVSVTMSIDSKGGDLRKLLQHLKA
jgi:hypothetical protein